MTFILVPSVALNRRAKNAGVELAPDAPIMVSRVRRSSSGKNRHRFPDQHHGGLDARRAEPVELPRIEPRLRRAEQRLERRIVLHEADHRAVALGGGIEIIGRGEPAGARHVAHDDGRMAGNVRADMAGNRPRQGVVAAGRAGGDDQRHRAAAVEIGDRIGRRRRQAKPCQPAGEQRKHGRLLRHRRRPMITPCNGCCMSSLPPRSRSPPPRRAPRSRSTRASG